MFSEENLARSLREIGASGEGRIFRDLEAAYTGEGRHYHTDRHVAECLRHFDRLRSLARRPGEIEVAIWFHDAVYDPRKADNEERSAEWAAAFLAGARVQGDAIDRIGEMIIATRTHEARDADTAILLDVDLGILGTAPAVFEDYDAAIRREYHFVPEAQFRAGRARILAAFLDRPSIYLTDDFATRYEKQARDNLRRKLAELQG